MTCDWLIVFWREGWVTHVQRWRRLSALWDTPATNTHHNVYGTKTPAAPFYLLPTTRRMTTRVRFPSAESGGLRKLSALPLYEAGRATRCDAGFRARTTPAPRRVASPPPQQSIAWEWLWGWGGVTSWVLSFTLDRALVLYRALLI